MARVRIALDKKHLPEQLAKEGMAEQVDGGSLVMWDNDYIELEHGRLTFYKGSSKGKYRVASLSIGHVVDLVFREREGE